MMTNVSITYDLAPPKGRVVIEHGKMTSGTMLVGWGSFSGEDGVFALDATNPAHLCLCVETDADEIQQTHTLIRVTDCDKPLCVALKDIMATEDQVVAIPEHGASVRAEIDPWGSI